MGAIISLEGELENLVVQEGVGSIYQDVGSFRKACLKLINDEIFLLLTFLQNNAKLCFAAKFNFASIYGTLCCNPRKFGAKVE